ncbi:MAG: hypothetical protein JAY88_12330 [Candidatus Thiodiazotropha lotti]|nr:hypothetical protein [Candidatus Thiodiazotropha lotti]MCW4187851.1 hypothetical protein [Candidatus Thiodiazotropha lotti]
MTNEKFLEGIESTGYGLEFSVSKSLMNKGWTVINNKYYIDDVQGAAREIDILAYKVTSKNDLLVYTVLIVSCKKSSENSWAFLAKNKNSSDPNVDWNPVTLWSNNKVLKLIIENYDWRNKYVSSSKELQKKLFSPEKHIFAFQELNSKNGKPKNDKAIFNSIVTSMKSQDYEIGSLNKRKKEESMYNFNLISVVDGSLLRINYGDGDPEVENIDSDIYVGSYIINKKETVSRVHFVKSDIFNSSLSIYDKLHLHNVEQSAIIHNSYYVDCLKDERKVALFKNKFNTKLRWDVYKLIRDLRSPQETDIKDVGVSWSIKDECAVIHVDGVYEDSEINALNSDSKIKTSVTKALKEIYRYSGDFYFEMEIPF